MIKQVVTLGIRVDPAGDGRFGAPRGSRTHRGVDYVCTPGQQVLSPVDGTVTKRGYAYGDDLRWRIVDVTDSDGLTHRLFYCKPLVSEGQKVTTTTPIGVAQDITERYPEMGMLPHIHYQVEDVDGTPINPSLELDDD